MPPHSKIVFADTLRGLAALLVLASHHWLLFWTDPGTVERFTGLPPLAATQAPAIAYFLGNAIEPLSPGPLGVATFFLVSGFVIPYSFERQGRVGFAVGRVFRLWPTYLAGFLITIAVIMTASRFYQTDLPFSGKEVAIHMILGARAILQSKSIDGIVWSLEVEIVFYTTALVVASELKRGRVHAFIIPILALLAVLIFKACSLLNIAPGLTLKLAKPVSFAPYLIFIYVGVAFNYWYRRFLSTGRTITITIFLLLAAGVGVALTNGDVAHLGINYLVAIGLFLLILKSPETWINNKFLRFFSQISYPLYVVHGVTGYIILYALIQSFSFGPPTAMILAFAAVIALACLLHVAIERPSHKLGQHFSKVLS